MSRVTVKTSGKLTKTFIPLSDSEWWRLGTAARNMIRKRTQDEGRDRHGHALKPYSKRYATRRTKTGRKAHPVSLTWTGDLWRAFAVVEKDSRRNVLGFLTVAEQRKASYLLKNRDFLGLALSEENELADLLARALVLKQQRRRR